MRGAATPKSCFTAALTIWPTRTMEVGAEGRGHAGRAGDGWCTAPRAGRRRRASLPDAARDRRSRQAPPGIRCAGMLEAGAVEQGLVAMGLVTTAAALPVCTCRTARRMESSTAGCGLWIGLAQLRHGAGDRHHRQAFREDLQRPSRARRSALAGSAGWRPDAPHRARGDRRRRRRRERARNASWLSTW